MDDLVRSRRKSTIEKSDRLKEIELERKNSKLKKANKKLSEAETSLIEETIEPEVSVIDTSPLGAVGGEIVRRKPNSNLAVTDDEGSEEEGEYFDPLGAIKSPTKRDSGRKESLVVTLTRKPRGARESDSWSIRFNQFFPSDCAISPPPYLSPPFPGFHGFINQIGEGQDTFLEVFEDVVGIDRDTSVELLPIEHHPSNMDANIYNARLKEVKKAFAIILHGIDMFGPEDITLEIKIPTRITSKRRGGLLRKPVKLPLTCAASLTLLMMSMVEEYKK